MKRNLHPIILSLCLSIVLFSSLLPLLTHTTHASPSYPDPPATYYGQTCPGLASPPWRI